MRRAATWRPFSAGPFARNMHEGISNHFSYAVSDDGQMFLMNPFGIHFSKLKASDMLLVDARHLDDEKAAYRRHRLGDPWLRDASQ